MVLRRAIATVWRDGRLFWPLLAANLVAIVFGWYYYAQVGQFIPGDLACRASHPFCQPVWLWPLVSDSPNALVLFTAAALWRRLGVGRSRWLDAFAFTLNVYVGLWTTFLFLAYSARMGTFEGGTNTVLFVTHMGMPLQALLLVPGMMGDRKRWTPLGGNAVAHRLQALFPALVGLLLAAFVYVDYWGPVLHPAPFLHPFDGLLHRGSPWIMAGAFGAWIAATRPPRPTRSTSLPEASQ